ncbi:hypothetical protein E1A91_A13G045400v1 [Gossypium mustelinum]|uniref:Glycosyltransferase n=1 Tax=Gossypium mustelinum TaxID=34275 RepID=A0A5D2WDP1_GOSMU|nr:hypothetical protein E1A91_A13G045400v1 [Gossypium mustelinum]
MRREIHMFFLPFLAHGHLIPVVDMAKMFASRGRSKESGIHIGVELLNFPAVDVGLPEGCENVDLIPTSQDGNLEMITNFFQAALMLQQPFEKLLQGRKPDCLVADTFFHWATDAANKFRIPRLVFHGISYFSFCASECMSLYKPYKKFSDIKLTRNQVPDYVKQDAETNSTKLLKAIKEAELKSYGVVVNSFYELEATYADYYRNVLGKKSWHVGPVSLCSGKNIDKVERGNKSAIDEQECLEWLESKEPNSVLYICFGSRTNFTSSQLKEIAMALEASELQFIWVVRKQKNNEEEDDWLPEGFEKRMEGKGLIIRGWAPQVLILDHEAVGGFVTHCGWNSTLEGVCAGVPMVTWPAFAEQFYNEKLLTQVLNIGVAVGAQKWVRLMGEFVERESIEKAVKEMMKGDKAEEMRNKAKALAEAAKKAVEKGGSSYSDLDALIEEISLRSH